MTRLPKRRVIIIYLHNYYLHRNQRQKQLAAIVHLLFSSEMYVESFVAGLRRRLRLPILTRKYLGHRYSKIKCYCITEILKISKTQFECSFYGARSDHDDEQRRQNDPNDPENRFGELSQSSTVIK
jgi:hypothetical protein